MREGSRIKRLNREEIQRFADPVRRESVKPAAVDIIQMFL